MPSRIQSVSLACPSCDLQGGDGRAGLLQDGPRLLHVEPGRGADPEFLLGEGQDSLLDPDVVPRDLDALLGDPILHVVRGHVRQQGHQGCVIVLHRSIQAGIGRLDVPADAAPQVELPAQVEAVEPVGERSRPLTRWEQVEKRPDEGHVGVEVDPAVRPGRLLGLGEDVAHGDRLAGPGLEDPCARDAEIRVLLVSRNNQGVERGIPEDLPPVLQVVVLHAGIIRLDPFRSHGCRRPAVIGPNLETIMNPLPRAGQ